MEIWHPLICALLALFMVSFALGSSDLPFIVAHKKASLNWLKSGTNGGIMSHSFELEAKIKEAFSTPILPLEIFTRVLSQRHLLVLWRSSTKDSSNSNHGS